MRRLVLLLVVALVGAGFAGRLVGATAVSVDGATLSDSQLRAELGVIARTPAYGCYLEALVKFTPSNSSNSLSAAGAATWARIQVEGLNVEHYVVRRYHWHVTPSELRTARTEYAADLTSAAEQAQLQCPATASATLASLPTWFLNDQLRQNAASEVFEQHLTGVVALTEAGLHSYYERHVAYYDTICISLAEVPLARATAFEKARAAGESVAELAKRYSIDASAAQGGTYGCYAPGAQAYSIVRSYTYGFALNAYPAQPHYVNTESGTEALFVAPTKRTVNAFTRVTSQVLTDAQNENNARAAARQSTLLHEAHVRVEPSLARWDTAHSTLRALLAPPTSVTPNAGAGLVG